MMPIVSLYEYFARTQAHNLIHTIFARLIKAEALVKLNRFDVAIAQLSAVQRGQHLPHLIHTNINDKSLKRVSVSQCS
jgi:hypothetical protein